MKKVEKIKGKREKKVKKREEEMEWRKTFVNSHGFLIHKCYYYNIKLRIKLQLLLK